ncbi:MAG: hypothetical protein H0V79_11260 [Actinobacteria bacterium]|nr:hypothetical protein [Actinomycetota bacterium]
MSRLALPLGGNALLLAFGALLVTMVTGATASMGPALPVGGLVALFLLAGLVVSFVAAPHVAVAGLIPVFAFLPMIKTLWLPAAGPIKDVAALAAFAGVALLTIERHRLRARAPVDSIVPACILALLALYVLNIGGGFKDGSYDVAWGHGVRLTAEPLLLLLLGLSVERPRRVFQWAMGSLVATSFVVALYGIAQQFLGPSGLLALGYTWDVDIKTIGELLRSFGTLDDPFLYAAFLSFGLVAVLFWMERGALALFVGTVLTIGIVCGFVRTSALIGVALIGIWLVTKKRSVPAACMFAAAVIGTLVIFFTSAQATESRTVKAGNNMYLTLNGRTEAWRVALGGPIDWPFGLGVGEVGTAAERATFELTRTAEQARESDVEAVDSGYFATIADVGFIGLGILAILLTRLFMAARSAVGLGLASGRVAMGILVVLSLDALTRSSFQGFPTAFIGMLLIGVALASAAAEGAELEERSELQPFP